MGGAALPSENEAAQYHVHSLERRSTGSFLRSSHGLQEGPTDTGAVTDKRIKADAKGAGAVRFRFLGSDLIRLLN
jgi:hypothetical protein